MKIALICPANIKYMPYIHLYTNILKQAGVKFDLINWDRLGIEDQSNLTYLDKENSLQKGFFSYLKYKKFLFNKIKEENYSHLIIFSLQLAFFLKNKLNKEFKNKFILDIRDYNQIIKLMNMKKIINNSYTTVISSRGFTDWLPKKESKVVISHNINNDKILNFFNNEIIEDLEKKDKIKVSYIGTIRDIEINLDLIYLLRDNTKINLIYNGLGDSNDLIKEMIKIHSISNVKLTGAYEPNDEDKLYENSDFINILIPNNDINSETLLPNRLYNAVMFNKPIITMDNTYVGDTVRKYKLGIVLSKIDDIEKEISKYIDYFNFDDYKTNRKKFIENTIKEQKKFENTINEFIHNK